MSRFDVLVESSLREGISDPQGSTIERALPALGFDGIEHVRVGKAFRFVMSAPDEAAARGQVEELSKRFLTNPVIEDFVITVTPASS
jgi:phosphoribosylformylglycinamidine synthase